MLGAMPALLLPLVLSLSSPGAGASVDAPAQREAAARPSKRPSQRPSKRPIRKQLRKPAPKPAPKDPPPEDKPDAAPAGELKLVTRTGSSQWWYGFDVTPSTQTLTKIELQHAGDSAWIETVNKGGYFALEDNRSGPFLLPFSVRVTDTGGNVHTATNVVKSWNPGEVHATGLVLSASPEPDESDEPAPPPSSEPPPETTQAAVTTQPQSGPYWYAFKLAGIAATITKIELRPAGEKHWRAADQQAGYWSILHHNGEPMLLPFSLRVTDSQGKTYTAVDAITSFASGQVYQLDFVVNAGS